MTLKLELTIDKAKDGLFNASVDYKANKSTHGSLSIRHETVNKAIRVAMEPILYIAPNLTQEELDKHHKAYPP